MNEFEEFVTYFIFYPIGIFFILGSLLRIYCLITGTKWKNDNSNDEEGDYGF